MGKHNTANQYRVFCGLVRAFNNRVLAFHQRIRLFVEQGSQITGRSGSTFVALMTLCKFN